MKKDTPQKMDFVWWRRIAAETFGSFCLLFFALATAVCNGGNIPLISFVCGCIIICLVYCLGPISGCNLAPSVSLGVMMMGGLTPFDFIFYVIGQTVGGLIGSLLLLGVLAMTDMDLSDKAFGLAENGFRLGGDNKSGLGLNLGGTFIVEIVMTFFFIFVILVIVSKDWPGGDKAGIVIGASLTVLMAVGLPLTGCGLNPVRSFGPAIALLFLGRTTAIAQFWPFLIAPLIGAALAAVFCKYFFLREVKPNHDEHPHIHIDDHHHGGTSVHDNPLPPPGGAKDSRSRASAHGTPAPASVRAMGRRNAASSDRAEAGRSGVEEQVAVEDFF